MSDKYSDNLLDYRLESDEEAGEEYDSREEESRIHYGYREDEGDEGEGSKTECMAGLVCTLLFLFVCSKSCYLIYLKKTRDASSHIENNHGKRLSQDTSRYFKSPNFALHQFKCSTSRTHNNYSVSKIIHRLRRRHSQFVNEQLIFSGWIDAWSQISCSIINSRGSHDIVRSRIGHVDVFPIQ